MHCVSMLDLTLTFTLTGYLPKLILYMVVPPMIAIVTVLVGLCRLRFANPPSAKTFQLLTVPFLLQLLFIAYPLVTNVVRSLGCQSTTAID